MKRFTVAFIVFVAFLFPLRIAEAMPEASKAIAIYALALPNYKHEFVDHVMFLYREHGVDALQDIEEDISALNGRATYTQEQATKEIAQLIADKKLPSYLLNEGEYKYDGEINSVYPIKSYKIPTESCKILSQPTSNANVKTEVYVNDDPAYEGHEATRAFDYWGEWTSPQGVQWVIVGYKDYIRKETAGDNTNDEDFDGYEDIENYIEQYEV